MEFQPIVDWVQSEWQVIAQSPATFAACVLILGLFIWKIIQREYSTQISNLRSTLALRETQLQDYKDKLSGATPDEAKARLEALERRLDELGPRLDALGPCRVTPEQREAMSRVLATHKGSGVSIDSDAASADAANLARSFAMAFNGAGWFVETPMVLGIGNPPPTGIGLHVGDSARLTEHEHCVANALRAAQIDFDVLPGWRQPPQREGRPEVVVDIVITNRLHD